MASGVLGTLRLTSALLVASFHMLLPVVATAFLSLLTLFLAFDSYSTHLLEKMVIALELSMEGAGGKRFVGLFEAVAEDVERLVVFVLASCVCAFLVSWTLTVVVVEMVATTARSDGELSLAEVLAKLKLSWKRTLLTEIVTTALRFLYSALFISLLTFATLASNGSLPILASTVILSLLATVRIESILHISSIVSVMEKEQIGFSALWRAKELMGGRGGDALGLSLVLLPAVVVVSAGLYVVKGDGVWFGVAETFVCVVAAVAVRAAWTVFYCGCLERRGEAMGEDDKKFGALNVNLPAGVCSEENV